MRLCANINLKTNVIEFYLHNSTNNFNNLK